MFQANQNIMNQPAAHQIFTDTQQTTTNYKQVTTTHKQSQKDSNTQELHGMYTTLAPQIHKY